MIISWNTTQACNIKCVHCYRDAGTRHTDELNTKQGKKLLEEIAKAGFKIVILSGGEPLLRQDILELIEYTCQLGMRPVIGTNGIMLNLDTVKKLKAAGLSTAGISLDSKNKAAHDWFRQSEGAWDKTMKGIKACREVGLPFQIHTTVMDWNQAEVLEISDLAIELGAVAHHIFFLVPAGRGKEIEEKSLKTEQYENLLVAILEKQAKVPIEIKPTCAPQFMRIAKQRNIEQRFTRGCLAGISYCVVLPNGEVQPCPYLPIKLGNVKEVAFDSLWRENSVFQELRHSELKGGCGSCGFAEVCGGCRARAYYYSEGD